MCRSYRQSQSTWLSVTVCIYVLSFIPSSVCNSELWIRDRPFKNCLPNSCDTDRDCVSMALILPRLLLSQYIQVASGVWDWHQPDLSKYCREIWRWGREGGTVGSLGTRVLTVILTDLKPVFSYLLTWRGVSAEPRRKDSQRKYHDMTEM